MKVVQDATRQLIADMGAGRGGVQAVWTADLMYDGERRHEGLTFAEEPAIYWDLSRFVACAGSVRIAYADVFGRSVVPREIGDAFSPFGAELQVDLIISAGRQRERIPMSRLVITDVPAAEDRRMLFQGVPVVPGETFQLEVKDRLTKVERDEFPVPTAAGSVSAWQEIQSVTGFPIIRSTEDALVPASLAYEGRKDPIVSKMFDLMEAWPHLTADGVLTALPKAWGDPVDEIQATVAKPVALSAERTYNVVVVEGKTPEGAPIWAIADVTEGFLRVRNADGGASPFGQKPYRYASEMLDTYEACARVAVNLLERVSRVQGVTRSVVEPLNPLREVGDVVLLDGGPVRIQTLSHRGAETRMTVEVPDN